MSISTDVKVQWVEGDLTVGSPIGIAPVQNVTALDPSLNLLRTSFTGEGVRRLSVTTTDRGRPTARIVLEGTGINDEPITDSLIPSVGIFGGTILSNLYFKTISSATVNGQYPYANSLSIGMLDDVRVIVGDGKPIRIKGYSTAAPTRNTNNFLEFHNGDFSPETLEFEVYIPPLNINYPIPDRGLVFNNGLYLQYVAGSLTMMNVFYA